MNAVPASASSSVLFQDPLGERRQMADASGADTLELLCLRSDLTSVPAFEFALRERVSRLANFRHAYYGRVRSVDRLNDGATLALVSDRVPGVRLSELLEVAEKRHLTLDINTAFSLIRQLVPAVALLHEHARDVAHGAIGPERLVITANARLVIVEHVLGAALEQLRFSQERYWQELRIPVPRSTGLPRFDHRADVMQMGIVALSLVLGRSLQPDEYPGQIADVVASAWAISSRGGLEPLPSGLRAWLTRALQLDPRNSFPSAVEARAELERMFGDSDYIVAPHALETFLAQYQDVRTLAEPPATPKRTEEPKIEAGRPAPPASEPVRTTAATGEPPKPAVVTMPPAAQPPVIQSLADSTAVSRSLFETQKPAKPTTAPSDVRAGGDALKSAAKAPVVPPLDPLDPDFSKPSIFPSEATLDRLVTASPKPAAFDATSLGDLAAFHAESESPFADDEDATEGDEMPQRKSIPNWLVYAGAAAVLVALVGGGVFAGRRYFVATASAPATGGLVVSTDPPGAQLTVDGVLQGVTPMSLTLRVGPHVVELRAGNDTRSIPVTIASGIQASQYIELSKAAPPTGQLQVRTEPAGAQVTVDGAPRGKAPLTISDLAPGTHAVVLENESGSIKQDVSIDAGATASLVVPMGTAAPAVAQSGWVSVSSPVTMQIFENGRLLGSSETERIMVSTGRHELELTNQPLAFRSVQVVQVAAGKVSPIKLDLPKQKIALNAVPWAEVWIDGDKIGETPIGDLSVTVGPHEVVFRHPQFGEQRHALTVTTAAPARLSVDMRKQ
jgi:serine/threonine protein kinase